VHCWEHRHSLPHNVKHDQRDRLEVVSIACEGALQLLLEMYSAPVACAWGLGLDMPRLWLCAGFVLQATPSP
jgi:hypothetical protein